VGGGGGVRKDKSVSFEPDISFVIWPKHVLYFYYCTVHFLIYLRNTPTNARI